MNTRRKVLGCLVVASAFAGGCSVDIKGATAGTKPPGGAFTANAITERHGASPTSVTMGYTHTRDGQGASTEQTPAVNSSGDDHSALVSPQNAAEFAPFDKVNLKWRVEFSSWGQGASRTTTEVVLIDPGLNLSVSPDPLTAGQTGNGVVSLARARTAGDVPVALEVTDQPRSATVTLSRNVVILAAGSTAVGGDFQILTTPTEESGGTVVGPGGGNPNSCEITATINLPGLPEIKKTARFTIPRP